MAKGILYLYALAALFVVLYVSAPSFGHECPRPERGTCLRMCFENQRILKKAAELAAADHVDLGPVGARLQRLRGRYIQTIPEDPGFGAGSEVHYQADGFACSVHGSKDETGDSGLHHFSLSSVVRGRSERLHGTAFLDSPLDWSLAVCSCDGPIGCATHRTQRGALLFLVALPFVYLVLRRRPPSAPPVG